MLNRRGFLVGSMAAGSVTSMFQDPSAAGSRSAPGSRPAPAPASAPKPTPASDLAPAAVDVLVFDTFGTVVDWRSAVISEGEALGRAKGLSVNWAAFADAWRGGYGPSLDRVRKGELPWTKLDVLHRRVLDELLTRFAIAGLSEEEKVQLNRVWHRLRGWPDSVAGLTRLKERYVIAPLSNGNLSLLTDMAKFAGLPWDCVLSTELVRHYKPDRETYLMAPDFFDLPPSRVMMVAAHTGDLDAAKALGLKTAYVHRPLEYGPDRATTRPDAGRFDHSVDDLGQLATALGA